MTSSINCTTGDFLSSKLGTREDMARYAQGWDRSFCAQNKRFHGKKVTLLDDVVSNMNVINKDLGQHIEFINVNSI